MKLPKNDGKATFKNIFLRSEFTGPRIPVEHTQGQSVVAKKDYWPGLE